MHRTLKQETARPPAPSLRAQQAKFDDFRNGYNVERLHEALADEKRHRSTPLRNERSSLADYAKSHETARPGDICLFSSGAIVTKA